MKLLYFIFFLISCSNIFSQTISIDQALRGEAETIRWELTYNSTGIITSCRKVYLPTAEILESLLIESTNNGLLAKYQVKNLTTDSQIELGVNELKIDTHIQNNQIKLDKFSKRVVQLKNNELIDTINGSIIVKVDTDFKQFLDPQGLIISERKGNFIFDYINDYKLKIIDHSSYIEIEREDIPATISVTKYKIMGNFSELKRSKLVNYVLLPYDLQFLLML